MIKSEFKTPMMRQYAEIKSEYSDCLLLFRMGDFYELFLDDAKTASKILDIALTSRGKGKDGEIPMAGVPYHSLDSYLPKLVRSGHKIAICEQISEPDGSGIVEREVVRIVTAGTVLDEKSLPHKENNYLAALSASDKRFGVAVVDLSTGDLNLAEINSDSELRVLRDTLSLFAPAEIILSESLYNNGKLLGQLKANFAANINRFSEWDDYAGKADKAIKSQFGVKTLRGFGLSDKPQAAAAGAGLLGYLKYTQKDKIAHLKQPRLVEADGTLQLDRSTIVNLELFVTLREQDKDGSLIRLLDETETAMGGRLLRRWLLRPLTSRKKIKARLTAVAEFFERQEFSKELEEDLSGIADIERLLTRLSAGYGNPRDLTSLLSSLSAVQNIKKLLKKANSQILMRVHQSLGVSLQEVADLIKNRIKEEPAADPRAGGIIRAGVDEKLDRLRDTIGGEKEWIAALEAKEKKRTGVSSLKVGFNKVFGYYIEVSKANLKNVPDHYIRKQTLKNAERYITPELKEHEQTVLTAEEQIKELEYSLFIETVEEVLQHLKALQKAASAIARLDCLLNFARIARKYNYTRPHITEDAAIKITNGRHPVVEASLDERQFVPNDVKLNKDTRQLLLVTGPNMAGKSVFIRQVALISLLAQSGSFVPAKKAELGIVDKIFVRSGAADAIASGLSTFMVEMTETARILSSATEKSLIVMDEIGRGTSTYDGISIAWAVAEYLVTNGATRAKTLFATHYHELQALAEEYSAIKNIKMAVEEKDGEPIFLYSAQEGGASHSYGIAVAKLAGVPQDVIERAKAIMRELEKREVHAAGSARTISAQQVTFLRESKRERGNPILKALQELDIENMTPMDALNLLRKMKSNV